MTPFQDREGDWAEGLWDEPLGNPCCGPGWAWGMLFAQDRP